MAATGAIIGGVAALGGTAYGVKASSDARSDAQAQAANQQQQAADFQKQASDKARVDQQQQAQTQMAALQSQKQRAAGAQSTFGGTLLTGPLGISGSTGTQPGQKTLLGT